MAELLATKPHRNLVPWDALLRWTAQAMAAAPNANVLDCCLELLLQPTSCFTSLATIADHAFRLASTPANAEVQVKALQACGHLLRLHNVKPALRAKLGDYVVSVYRKDKPVSQELYAAASDLVQDVYADRVRCQVGQAAKCIIHKHKAN